MKDKEIYKGDGWEQVTLGLFGERRIPSTNERKKSSSNIQNNVWSIEKENWRKYLQRNNITDNTPTTHLSYIDFSYWLYYNFKEFRKENEIETDVWQVKNGRKDVKVKISSRNDTNELVKQYISVSFSTNYGSYYGWSGPNYTLAEVKKSIERALKDLNER